MYDKNELRNQMKAKRKSLAHDEIEEKSARICELLINSDAYKNAHCICVYMAAFNEPRTTGIIRHALSDSKQVCVPITDTESGTLTLSYISDINSLVRGAYGIFEPSVIDLADETNVELVLVPGIAFDERGNRIGFGKGYYDKLLTATSALKAGVCYAFQICEGIGADEHDIPMDILITEEGIQLCR